MEGLGKALMGFFWFCISLAAVVGWAIIEGLLWVVDHISLTWI